MNIKTVEDKSRVLKERMEAQRKLGAQIDVLVRQAEDGYTPGCGICSIWRRLSGRHQAVALAAAAEATSTKATAKGTATQARLFGIKRADPHSKLAEAAESMEKRIQELELRVESERQEAKKQMQIGNKGFAMRMLKKAKTTEKQLEANQAALLAVEQQVDLMAQAKMQKEVASALASSSKGMKAQKKLLKNAESAVDEAQDARDMADDLGNVMAEFAANGNGDADEEDLLAELQQMIDNDPIPPSSDAVEESMSDEAKAAEIATLEAKIAQHERSIASRRAVEMMPAAPTNGISMKANGKARMRDALQEKEALLASVSNGHS